MLRNVGYAVLLAGLVSYCQDTRAQAVDVAGTAALRDWPREGAIGEPADYRLLPFVDSLGLEYRFAGDLGDAIAPTMHFVLGWQLGNGGILDGRRVDAGRMPDDIAIDEIDLVMTVESNSGESVADFFLPLEGIALRELPEVTLVDVEGVTWDSVFVGVGEAETRSLFEDGFRLTELRIVRAVFMTRPPGTGSAARIPPRQYDYDHRRTVFVPDVEIWLTWSDVRSSWWRRPYVRTRSAPRGSDTGREADRDSRFGRLLDDLDDVDDDDDDDDRLYPAAIAGAVAVGALAFAGGTVGYFAAGEKAPIGLMSGVVRPRGGALLHVSVNRQVFGAGEGSENLVAGLIGFYGAPASPVKPALGLGVRLTEEDTEGVDVIASVSLGAVGIFGRLVVIAGYDPITPDWRLGMGVNLR